MTARRCRLLPLMLAALAVWIVAAVAALPAAAQSSAVVPSAAKPAAAPPPSLPAPKAKLPDFKPGTNQRFEMVLIHGLGGAAAEWGQIEPYLKGTFKVASFELAGHGSTQPVMDPTVVTEAKRLGEFIRTSGMSYPTLVGHGLGGMVALQYALDHPGEIHRLILLDTAPRQLAGQEQKAQIGQALIEDYDKFVGERYALMSPDDAISERILDMALRTHAASFVSLLLSSFDFDLTDRLGTLTVPMLVVGSEMMFPRPDDTQSMLVQYGYNKARSLSFKRFGKTGHYIMLEQPVMLASVLMAFGVSADYEFEP
jgi:pimeloyl-ACP methyl ester carboxylesterase